MTDERRGTGDETESGERPSATGSGRITRRSALAAIGLTGLLGLGATGANADPQGQVGTGSDPVEVLHTEAISGGITGTREVTDLAGSGLSISGGSLTANVDPDTHTDVSDDGTTVVSGTDDVDFRTSLTVTDNGDSTVSVDACTGAGRDATVAGGVNNAATGINATVGGGKDNSASDPDATVGGGLGNTASGSSATIGGGGGNLATAGNTVVAGGSINEANETGATVGGGSRNRVLGEYGTIGGGAPPGGPNNIPDRNIVFDDWGTIGGGGKNRAGSDDRDSTTNRYATVAGGRGNFARGSYSSIGGGGPSDPENNPDTTNNVAYDDWGTIGGGGNNQAGSDDDTDNSHFATVGGGTTNVASGTESTVAGGGRNTATGESASVGGGYRNDATGRWATIPGGHSNDASGRAGFAAGRYAAAADDFSFVWNDGSGENDANGALNDKFSSSTTDGTSGVTGANTFHVKSTGGARFVTATDNSQVTYIPDNSAGWSSTSTRTAKTNVDPVDPESALAGVESLDVATWEYKDDDGDGAGTTHVGPMAEDFHDAFDVGDSERTINSINADGVAFAAIQGLAQRLDEREATIESQRERIGDQADRIEKQDDRIERQTDRIDAQRERIDRLESENEALHERLDELEDRVGATNGGDA